ncbi:MAG TPA: methyl-accepting chemotaxis protein [Spirochaetota bacterium]|nr:methyl-accepting chemotaxis protein [Spirochaetota bacterium]
MRKGLTGYFLQRYIETGSFLLQQKVRLLVYFNLVLFGLMPPAIVGLNMIQERGILSLMNAVLVLVILVTILSMVLIRKGFYNWAANIVAICTSAGIVAMAFNAHGFRNADHISNFFYMSSIIVFAALFCRKAVVIGISAFFLASGVYSYIRVMPLLEEVYQKVAQGMVGDYMFAALLTAMLSYITVMIHETSNRYALDEAEKNRRQCETTDALLYSVQGIAATLAESSEKMSATSSSFSDNAQSQAASAEEITSTIEEISAGVENVAESVARQYAMVANLLTGIRELSGIITVMSSRIEESAGHASEISDQGESGERSLSAMSEGMKNIMQSSRDMNGIIGIINDIADQINLLSLNAAIEAARAGDAGRGFAVVADEISKLADRTASSIKDISTLIGMNEKEINRGIADASNVMGLMNGIVSGIEGISSRMGDILNYLKQQIQTSGRVEKDAESLRAVSDEIKTAAEEQKVAASEITRSISIINEIAQSNADGAGQIAEGARELAGVAETLKGKVTSF